jgi:hypothetical protein
LLVSPGAVPPASKKALDGISVLPPITITIKVNVGGFYMNIFDVAD